MRKVLKVEGTLTKHSWPHEDSILSESKVVSLIAKKAEG